MGTRDLVKRRLRKGHYMPGMNVHPSQLKIMSSMGI